MRREKKRSLQFLNYIRPKQITLKNGLTYEPTGMSAGNFRLAENQLSDWNSASNNFCLTLAVCDHYIGRLRACLHGGGGPR